MEFSLFICSALIAIIQCTLHEKDNSDTHGGGLGVACSKSSAPVAYVNLGLKWCSILLPPLAFPKPQIWCLSPISKRYIVMDYMNALDESLVQADSKTQEWIFTQLRNLIAQLRSLESPQACRLQAADGDGLFDVRHCLF